MPLIVATTQQRYVCSSFKLLLENFWCILQEVVCSFSTFKSHQVFTLYNMFGFIPPGGLIETAGNKIYPFARCSADFLGPVRIDSGLPTFKTDDASVLEAVASALIGMDSVKLR